MIQLPRFVVARASIEGAIARLMGTELHHLRDVRRLLPGNEVTLIDETNQIYRGRIQRFESDCAIISVERQEMSRLAPEIILAVGFIKGPRMDLLVEKAVELGASELIPLATARSVVRAIAAQRLERWRRLTIAAAKQSLAPRRMTLRSPATVAQLVRDLPQDTLAVICLIDAPRLSALIRAANPRRLLLACGPEGGFDPDEIALMRDAGFRAAALGPNRLRSETAALAALSIASAIIDEITGRS